MDTQNDAIYLGGKSSGPISQVAGPEARVNAIRDSWGNSSFSIDVKGGHCYKESQDNFYESKPAISDLGQTILYFYCGH